MRLLLKNMGLYEYHIVHLAILSDALKVASSSEKLGSYMLRGLWKSAVNIVFHSEREENISNKELKPIQCRLPRYLTKPRQRRSKWDMAGSDGISRVSAVFRGKSLLTNKMRII